MNSNNPTSMVNKAISFCLLKAVRAYQLFISPITGRHCRFYPSCSQYAYEAVCEHGAFKGSLMAGKRICKCHPGNPGGIDLVPEKRS